MQRRALHQVQHMSEIGSQCSRVRQQPITSFVQQSLFNGQALRKVDRLPSLGLSGQSDISQSNSMSEHGLPKNNMLRLAGGRKQKNEVRSNFSKS